MAIKARTTFEAIRKTGSQGLDFWYASDVQKALEVGNFDSFKKGILHAKELCQSAGVDVRKHFANDKSVDDVALSQFACYLIVKNDDSFVPDKRVAKVYYSRMSPRQAATPEAYAELEARKRLMLRPEHISLNKVLASTAKQRMPMSEAERLVEAKYKAGQKLNDEERIIYIKLCKRIAAFLSNLHDHANIGLYDGMTSDEIHQAMGLVESHDNYDYMYSAELVANMLKAELAICNIQSAGSKLTQAQMFKQSNEAGYAVRWSMLSAGVTKPENLLAAEQSINQLRNGFDPSKRTRIKLITETGKGIGKAETDAETEKQVASSQSQRLPEADIIADWYGGGKKKGSTTESDNSEKVRKQMEAKAKREAKAVELAEQAAAREKFEAAQMKLF